MNSNKDVRDLHPYNIDGKDALYTDSKGRRVFFKEDGTPFVFDSIGRKITRFKGQEAYRNQAPPANIVELTPRNSVLGEIQSNQALNAFQQPKTGSMLSTEEIARRIKFDSDLIAQVPKSFVETPADPEWSAKLKAEHEAEKAQVNDQPVFNREKIMDANGNPVVSTRNKLNGENIAAEEEQLKRNELLETRAQSYEDDGYIAKSKETREGKVPEEKVGVEDRQYGALMNDTKLTPTEEYKPAPAFDYDDSKEKIEQIKYDSDMQAKLAAQIIPGEGGLEDNTQTRLSVTRHIQNNLGGIEAYQYAQEVIPENELSLHKDIQYDEKKGQYYRTLTDGTTHFLSSTYDADGRAVVADIRSGVYEHIEENGKKTSFDYFTPAMIDGETLDKKGLPFIQNIRSQLVLTDVGEQELESKIRLRTEISQSKEVVNQFIEDLKVAKEVNAREQIKLSRTVQDAFGLETDTIGSMHAFTSFKGYTQQLETLGIRTPQMFGSDLNSKRAFDATLNAAYSQRNLLYNAPVYQDIKRWTSNQNTVNNERIELLREANEKADIKDWHLGTDAEEESRARQERAMSNEERERRYLLGMEEEHDRQLRNIRDGLDSVGHSNEQAKKQIMNAVQQGIVKKQDIDPKVFDASVSEQNSKLLAMDMKDIPEERQAAIGDYLNRHRASMGLEPINAFVDMDETVGALKSFAENDPGAQPMPDASRYAFYNKVDEAGLAGELKSGSLPRVELTDEERTSYNEWSSRTSQTMAFNRDREAVLNLAVKEEVNFDGNVVKKSRFSSTYDEALSSVNKYRLENGMEPTASLVPTEMIKNKVGQEAVESWKEFHDTLERNDQLFRLQGDKAMYNLKEVNDNGTIIAERVTLPVKSLDVSLNFEKDINTSDVMDAANKRLIPEEEGMKYQLSDEQRRALDDNRTIRLDTAIKDAKKNIDSTPLVNGTVDMPINSFIIEALGYEENVNLGNFTGEKQRTKTAYVNKRMVDVMSARAGWMLRKGMTDEVGSAMNAAMYEATMELSNKGKTISLASKEGRIASFDEEFEDTFTKHLHKEYFRMAGASKPTEATDILIRDVAQIASQSLQEDPDFMANVKPGTPEFLQHVESETFRMLNDSAGQMISEDFPYYEQALDSNKIREVVSKQQDSILSLDDSYMSSSEYSTSAEDAAVNSQMEKIDAQEAEDAMHSNEKSDRERDMAARGTNITEGRAQQEIQGFNRARSQLEELSHTPKDDLPDKKFSIARQYFGDEYVDHAVEQQRKGAFPVPNEFQLLKQYKEGRLNVLEKEKGQGYGYDMMKAMYQYDGLGDNFFKEAMSETLNPTIGSVDRLRSYLELRDAMPELEMKVGVDGKELRRLNPEVASMVPNGDSFDLEVGREGEIIARSKTTNKTFGLADTTSSLGEERTIPHEIAFNAGSVASDKSQAINKNWTKDATAIPQKSSIPLAVNSPYNVSRVTRAPMGNGHLSSSDVGTRAGVQNIMNGAQAAGVDFETTGLMNDERLKQRGLILPTEAFIQDGQMTPEGWQAGEGKHLMLDIGSVKDNRGLTVSSIINDEFGKMTGDDLIKRELGEGAGSWDTLSEGEKRQVMKSDAITFTRNIGKYDPNADPLVKDFNHVPASLDKTFSKWTEHAKIGLGELATGAGKEGVEVHKDLNSFMNAYGEATNGKTLVMQNGADADIPWANHFAHMSKADINKKPELVEMMHLSRMLNPEARSHSLENQIGRVGGNIQQEYNNGSHLADTDTKAMMRLFGENYLSNEKLTGENGLMNVEWMNQGDTVVKLGSRGAGKVPHDMYEVQGYNRKGNMHQLHLQNLEGTVETIEAPSLQELQRNVTQNFKGFTDKEAAQSFINDLTFDDAREDISRSLLDYDSMIREKNRAEGGGVNTGLQNAKARYDELQNQYGVQPAMNPENLSEVDQKILQNEHLFSDDYYEPRVAPTYSDRQQRAMQESKPFYESEDAQRRQAFLGEVSDLQAAGVVDEAEGRDLINQFNNQIKEKAAAVGASSQRSVPGLTDLGTLQGQTFGPLAGRQVTALANTHEQAEQELWKTINDFKPLTNPAKHNNESAWKSEALDKLMVHLRQQGMNPAGNSMEDAVDAVMARHQQTGDMMVDDLTKPLIQGQHEETMRQAFDDAHSSTMSQVNERLATNPALKRSFERTQALRQNMEQQGLATDRMNYRMASDYEGRNLPVTGEYAMRDANDLKAEVDLMDGRQEPERHNALWKEIYGRATGGYDDAVDAQSILGWDKDSTEFVHPYAVGDNLAGTRYADMDMRNGLEDPRNDVNRIRLHSWDNKTQQPTILSEKASLYLKDAIEKGRMIDPPIEEADNAARDAIRGGASGSGGIESEYRNEYGWERPEGANRPQSGLQEQTRAGREALVDHLKQFTASNQGKATGLIAAALGAAFVVRQWTRGDLAEERPGHNASADGTGNYHQSPPAHSGPPPSGGQTYLTGDNGGGVAVQVQAKNRNGATQDQIAQALNQGMGGNASVNIHHRDDTSSISSDWLRDKFSQLLETGYAN